MTLTRQLRECSIPVGSPNSRIRFNSFTKRIGADYIKAKQFACRGCRQKWCDLDFDGAYEVDTITCSNCYGEDIVCTLVEAVFV